MMPKIKLKGVFTIRKLSAGGVLLDEWQFENMILDAGLNRYGANVSGSSPLWDFIYLSTATADPAVTDTAMGGTVISSNSGSPIFATGVLTNASAGNSWVTIYRTGRRFAVGAGTGTWSMVGIGTAAALFAKTRIKDGGGNPSSITVLSSEQLDISYDISIQWPTTANSGTIVVNGTSYNYTAKCAGVASLNTGWSPNASIWANNAYCKLGSPTSGGALAFNSDIGLGGTYYDNLDLANVNTSTTAVSASNYGTYVAGTFTRTISFSLGTTAVLTGDRVCGMQVQPGGGPMNKWVFIINDGTRANGIPKTNLDTLGLTFGISWGRA